MRYGGRSKGTPNKINADFAAACRQYGFEALAAVVRLMRSTEDGNTILQCAEWLTNRGFGRPFQAVGITGGQGEPLDYAKLNDGQLQLLIARLEHAIAASSGEMATVIEGRAIEASPGDGAEARHGEATGRDTEEL
jgi:hypothetical protein